jgi:hypothetical protein
MWDSSPDSHSRPAPPPYSTSYQGAPSVFATGFTSIIDIKVARAGGCDDQAGGRMSP